MAKPGTAQASSAGVGPPTRLVGGLRSRSSAAAHAIHRNRIHLAVRLGDGQTWFEDQASCVLVANVGSIGGGVAAFEHPTPEDGKLDVAVMTANGTWQWLRTLRGLPSGMPRSRRMTQATKIKIETRKSLPYELDGGARPKTATLRVEVIPHAVTIRVVSHATG